MSDRVESGEDEQFILAFNNLQVYVHITIQSLRRLDLEIGRFAELLRERERDRRERDGDAQDGD